MFENESDVHIEKQMTSLLSNLHKELAEFIVCIQNADIMEKEEKTNAVYDTLAKLRSDAEIMVRHLESMVNKGNPNEKYIYGKLRQLEQIKQHLTSLIDVFDENPNITDYKEGLLQTVIQDINSVISDVQGVVKEDEELRKIFDEN